MADVPPDFRGISLKAWRAMDIRQQCEDYLKTRAGVKAPLADQGISGPRDRYGWRSL